MLKNIPVDSGAMEKYARNRELRKEYLIEIRGMRAPFFDRVMRLFGMPAQTLISGTLPSKRLKIQNEQDRRTIAGISSLKAMLPSFLDKNSALFSEPSAKQVTAEDWKGIVDLYHACFQDHNASGVIASAGRCCLYAKMLSEKMSDGEFCPALSPMAMGAVGLMRNAASLLGENGYHRKQLVARRVWKEVGIHEGYLNALRPPSVDSGPLRRSEYKGMDEDELREAMQKREEQIWAVFKNNPDALWVEFAGFMASKAYQNGTPWSFYEILEHARKSRSSREGYERHTNQQSLFFSSRYATDTLSPEFEEVWLRLYQRCYDMIIKRGVDLNFVRTQIMIWARKQTPRTE